MSSRLLRLMLWSAVILLGRVARAAGAQSRSQQEPACVATGGGRCEEARGGVCPPVDVGSRECTLQREPPIELRQSGCNTLECTLQSNFCNGVPAVRVSEAHFPVRINYTVHNYRQFNVTASINDLEGGWNYAMIMTDENGRSVTTGHGHWCTCGSSNGEPEVSVVHTSDFGRRDKHRSLHLCLSSRDGSRLTYVVQNFSAGSSCLDFVNDHNLPLFDHLRCNHPVSALGIEPVTNLDVQVAPASLVMQVSWTRPIFLPRGLVGLTYYVELNSSLGAKIFTVSDSTNVTCTVSPGLNYTVTVRTWVFCEPTACQNHATSGPVFVPFTTRIATTSTPPPTYSNTTDMQSMDDPYRSNVGALVAVVLIPSLLILFVVTILMTIFYKCIEIRKNGRPCSEAYSVERPRLSTSRSTVTTSTPHMQTDSRTPSPMSDSESSTHTFPKQVLVVGSLRTPTTENAELVAPLVVCTDDIKLLMYDVQFDTKEAGERFTDDVVTKEVVRRPTPSRWVQQAMNQAHCIMCICNKDFMDDWNYDGKEMHHEASLVASVSNRVEGLANHGQHSQIRRDFIVVVHTESDSQNYIPDNLKNCNMFVLNCNANIERLAKFLLGIPAVTFQRIDPE